VSFSLLPRGWWRGIKEEGTETVEGEPTAWRHLSSKGLNALLNSPWKKAEITRKLRFKYAISFLYHIVCGFLTLSFFLSRQYFKFPFPSFLFDSIVLFCSL
jgi:hypothetical protein